MKKHLSLRTPLITILIVAYSFICNSQTLTLSAVGSDIKFSHDTTAEITSFTCKRNDGKTYLQWDIMNLKNNGTFIIYRSTDGENFQSIGTKKGVGVPISKEIAYYFVDTTAPYQAYYRLVFIANNNSYFSSNILDSDMGLSLKR